ncbi:olfactory receptor 4D10-like [Etheostoma spectabile]|uniref:olfactory receptor 4D10-like n=1 Tax=Etheostoma spectabile TaxID=54343 RepID=UPI0013AEB0FA|nr:olfactory receptor 4D10-like [Etheostoma spectabile]
MSLQNASINITEFILTGFDTTKRPIVVGVVILITYVLAVSANILNILFIICDKRLHKPMYILICNLAVVDILFTSSCPTMIGVLVAGVSTISYVPCLIQMYVYHLGMVMEMFTLSVMAFDRLIAFNYPFHYHSYLTNVRILILTCILLGVVLNLEARQGLTIGSIVAHPLLNPLVYCFRTKEIKCKIFRIFKKV